jgi:DNA-binding Lrp family transcriptional regulator
MLNQNPIDRAAEIKRKILAFLEKNGPSLPVPIARETGISSLFSSAFLSEMLEDGAIKISKLKVGGSPLYFLPNQEAMLENFIRVLPQKEKEAHSLIKEKQIVQDTELEPSIRVAMRGIKDFAFPVTLDYNNEKMLFWRYMSIKETEALEKIKSGPIKSHAQTQMPKQIPQPQPMQQIVPEIQAIPQIPQQAIPKPAQNIIKEPAIKAKPKQTEPSAPAKIEASSEPAVQEVKHTDFSRKIEQNLMQSNLEVIERIEVKKKDYLAKILVSSQIGKTPYLCIAKDKKKLTDNDLALAVQKAQAIKLPVLFISQGSLSEKAKLYLKTWEGMLKFSSIN